jgi:glycosyltransferase involved in cell wall biosynthesis
MMKKKKRLLIIGSSQGVYGGIEAFMMAIAEAAKDWPEFDVKLCYKIVDKNIKISADLLDMSDKSCDSVYYVYKASPRLLKLISWADVLHIQNMPPDIVFPAFLLGKKNFLTVHNRRKESLSLHNVIWGYSIRFAERRWFNSNFVWDTWEPDCKRLTSQRVPTVCRLPTKFCEPEQRKGFLFVGRWIANKGIEELLQAYKKCGFDATKWPLTILGNGPLKNEILLLIEKLGLADVSLPGFVNDEEKQQYISMAKWLVAPAKTSEDLGLTPIEARSVGVPSIVTRDGGLPESAGPAALIAEPGDVDDLANCLLVAAGMTDIEYLQRSLQSQKQLESFLEPLEFYRHAFSN